MAPEPSAVSRAMPPVRVGTYGFAYKEWVGPFYPPGTSEAGRLTYYAGVFNAVELVHTYYGAPKPPAVERWRDQTPDTFKIAVKAPRWLTLGIDRAAKRSAASTAGAVDGLKRLNETLAPLGSRLGPIVLRMEDTFDYPGGLAPVGEFLEATSRDRANGASDSRLAIEFHHPSWWEGRDAETLLRDHDVAWVLSDVEPHEPGADLMPRAIDAAEAVRDTSSALIYVRLSGNHAGKKNHYTPRVDRSEELHRWADLLKRLLGDRPNRTAYVLLSDHYAGVGPDTARELADLLD